MASVFITGSSDGLGLMVAKLLVDEGHELALQGRNEARRKSGKVACDRVLGARRRAAATAATLTDIAMLLHSEDSWRRDAASFLWSATAFAQNAEAGSLVRPPRWI